MAREICRICGRKTGIVAYVVADGLICKQCGKEIRALDVNGVLDATFEQWTANDLKQVKAGTFTKKDEIRNKCNVCGNLYCYTQSDLNKNVQAQKQAKMSALAGVAGAVTGNYAASAVNTGNANNKLNNIVDYTKCPKCNSTDISVLTDEEWKKEIAAPQGNTQAVSSADELKKFKDLLDSGVITQEEFDAKKKQLLGL